jgi:diguanylate cyclase (GGDEF)-like protein/PAS domain S-box-containing protein
VNCGILAFKSRRKSVAKDNATSKISQRNLKESPELAQALLRCAGTGIYIVQSGTFRYVNSLFEDLTGYAEEELLHTYSLNLVHPEDRENVRNKAIESLKGAVSRPYEYRFIKKNGDIIWILEKVTSTIYEGRRAAVGSFIDITEHKLLEHHLAEMATHDALTGLPNRVLLSDRLSVELAQAQRNHTRLAVMMLDLDRFKEVNDLLGHGIGDQLLGAVAQRLTKLIRKGDTVSRIGGDEFVLLLPQVGRIEDATKIAQKILAAFRAPFALENHQVHITTSIGISLYPEDGADVKTLLKNADTAMYWVKEQGRNNYELYWYDSTDSTQQGRN